MKEKSKVNSGKILVHFISRRSNTIPSSSSSLNYIYKTGFKNSNKNIVLREVGNRCCSKARGIDQKEVAIDKKRVLCCLKASRCAASYRFSSATTLAQLANLSASCMHAVSVRRCPQPRSYYRTGLYEQGRSSLGKSSRTKYEIIAIRKVIYFLIYVINVLIYIANVFV